MRRSTRQRQAAAAATASTKHTTASTSSINPITAIRACPAAPAEILAALDQIEQVLLDRSRIYILSDCNLDLTRLECLLLANPGKILFLPSSSIPADRLTSGEYYPTACYHDRQPHKRSFVSGFFDPLEQWELQHAAFSAPIMLCQPINHYRHSPLHQDYGTAINVLLQLPTNQQLFKLWVVLVPSDPTAIIPTLNPLSFAQAMALEVGPSCTYTARICFVKRPGDLSVIPSGYPHAVITVSTTRDATSIMGGAHVIFPKDYLYVYKYNCASKHTYLRGNTNIKYHYYMVWFYFRSTIFKGANGGCHELEGDLLTIEEYSDCRFDGVRDAVAELVSSWTVRGDAKREAAAKAAKQGVSKRLKAKQANREKMERVRHAKVGGSKRK
ncbi:hypothetical protein BDR26DRAFT_1009293 [Obelidium mucronatum]|nr:hypothetical protein BDR26DRAFT_1015667 [Obelidium mucronatum]KAI9335552.1 hypothetical protein BDR26DRAFT_1009293 [Obelidium mucronatum]